MLRRVAASLALALCLLGCTSDVKLLTGGHGGCSIGGTSPMSISGVLIPDAAAGTTLVVDPDMARAWGPEVAGTTVRVMWTPGFTARWSALGEVEVVSNGDPVIKTGQRVVLQTQFMGGISDGVYTACDADPLITPAPCAAPPEVCAGVVPDRSGRA